MSDAEFLELRNIAELAQAYRIECEERHGGPEWDGAWDDLCIALDHWLGV